jgi:hypothetical protein
VSQEVHKKNQAIYAEEKIKQAKLFMACEEDIKLMQATSSISSVFKCGRICFCDSVTVFRISYNPCHIDLTH